MVPAGIKVCFSLFGYELQELAKSFRFRALAPLVAVLMVALALLHSTRYRVGLEEYHQVLAMDAGEGRSLTVAQLTETVHMVVKPPWKLAFLAEGESSRVPFVYRHGLSPKHAPEVRVRHSGSERQNEVEVPDWLYVVRVIQSMAALVLGYDAVCATGQRTRLQLLLSYGVRRGQVLAAKFFALWSCLVSPFVGGALLSLPIVTVYGSVQWTAAETFKVASIVLLGLWAAAVYGLAALWISALHRESSHSLVVAALLWVTAAVVIPAVGGLLARWLLPLPTAQEISSELRAIDHGAEAREGFGIWRGTSTARLDDYFRERRSAEIENVRFRRGEEIHRNLVRLQFRQVDRARLFAALSPLYLVEDLGERLVGSGSYRDRFFMEQAWAFRETLAAHVRRLDLDDPESPHLFFFPRYLSKRPAHADAVPRFAFQGPTVSDGLRSAGRHLLLLATWTLVMAVLALKAWRRYDVG